MISPEPSPSLAASLEVNVLRLELIDRARSHPVHPASWAVIGRTLGMSGREAKRHVHKLRAEVKRAQLTEPQ